MRQPILSNARHSLACGELARLSPQQQVVAPTQGAVPGRLMPEGCIA
jgi:hypothetical protein